MKDSCKISWTITAISVVAVAVMAYNFIIRGSVKQADDGRTALLLEAADRDFVLEEMRTFLEAVQTITEALPEEDMKTIEEASYKVGMAQARAIPAPLMGKLPIEFKTLGFSTHEAFDSLAVEAREMGDPNVILTKLSQLLINCNGCHASYRIDLKPAGK